MVLDRVGTPPLYLAVRIIRVRIVLQRVSSASVKVAEAVVGEIGPGLLLLVGVEDSDIPEDATAAAEKISGLRIFSDGEGRMNLSLAEVGGSVLVVSQFTLLGDVRRGRRPSFTGAGDPSHAREIINLLVEGLNGRGIRTETGSFGARMHVALVNEGPVTLIVDVHGGRVA